MSPSLLRMNERELLFESLLDYKKSDTDYHSEPTFLKEMLFGDGLRTMCRFSVYQCRLFRTIFFSTMVYSSMASSAAVGEEAINFNRDVRPILSDHCFACHGFDEKTREASLRLDVAEGAYADLGGYHAVVAGKPDESELWKRVIADDPDEMMPPADFGKPLSNEQKSILKRWIEQGAEYQQHWSFIAPHKPQVPDVAGVTNPIDAFLQQRLQAEGLKTARQADKTTQIRRVTLDLTGLPPTLAEIDTFLEDDSPDAYEKLVERLQARVTYGEHMARYWLDLARYADTHGLHLDNERSMWPYRDWVVQAINNNLPFDEFTRWQLAGDLLPDPTREQLIASGFNRCNVTTSEGGSIAEEWIYRYAVDRTTTAIEVWMGLTGGCAVCHDHKFDPLSARDYYSMYAFFHSAADPAMDGNQIDTPPILKLTRPEDELKLKELDQKIAEVENRITELVESYEYSDPVTQSPQPTERIVESVWFEDQFPAGSNPEATGAPLQIVSKPDGNVFSDKSAISRSAPNAIGQDFFQGGAEFTVPKNSQIFAWCFLDPDDPPQTIMLQFHVGGWNRRAVWGNADLIPWGKPETAEKFYMGELPAVGKWVRLQVDPAKLNLKPGTKIGGYAFTQYGGTVNWDRLGVTATVNPTTDPAWSFTVWKEQNQGKRNNALPEGLRQLVRGKKAEQWTEQEADQVFHFWLRTFFDGLREEIALLEDEKAPFDQEKLDIEKAAPITMIMADLPQPRESFVMLRGAYDRPGEQVTRGVPGFLPPLPEKPTDRDYNRLDLANWLVSRNHPLTARVTVNRLWQQFFDTGLVKTSWDFGSQGDPPSHPELLDWLAVQLIDDGWDMKKFIRRIVTSHAYRQSSYVAPDLLERDPENRLLARGPRHRLDAEVLRDQALFVSGLLVPTVGGKGVKPYQPPNIWEPVGFGSSNTRYYKQDSGDALYRRSLYTFLKRTAPPPFLASFDAPNREQSCARRGRSNTPLQALQLMNDIQHVEAAREFASRILKEGGASDEQRLRWAWRTVTSRPPDDAELAIVVRTLELYRARYQEDKESAVQLIAYGESTADPNLAPTELAAYTLIANMILNLDETVSKN